MLGQDLVAHLATRHEVIPTRRHDVDITDSASVTRALDQAQPESVIHAAAFTAVDECQARAELAPLRRLELHHVGAVVGEQHRAVGPGEEAREVEHAHARQRSRHPTSVR